MVLFASHLVLRPGIRNFGRYPIRLENVILGAWQQALADQVLYGSLILSAIAGVVTLIANSQVASLEQQGVIKPPAAKRFRLKNKRRSPKTLSFNPSPTGISVSWLFRSLEYFEMSRYVGLLRELLTLF